MSALGIQVPDAVPMLPELEGNPGQCEQVAADLSSLADRCEGAADTAARLSELGDSWIGIAFLAYQRRITTAGRAHADAAAALRGAADGVDAFAGRRRAHLAERQKLTELGATADAERFALLDALSAIEDPTDAAADDLRDRAQLLATQYAEIAAQQQSLVSEITESEEALAAILASAPLDGDLELNLVERVLAVVQLWPGTVSAADRASWWANLTTQEREAAIEALPELIGSGDGLPASARDAANRILLERDLTTLSAKERDGTITETGQKTLTNARATQEALKQLDDFTDPISGQKAGGTLWLYDPRAFNGDGRIAVAVGDLDTATDVAVQVPGITTEMTDAPGYATKASNLYESARYGGDGSSVASMFWLGYDTPESAVDVDTLTTGRAEDGGGRLADAIDALRASRADTAHLTVIGHSYGSTTTSYAATEHDLDADNVALIGSPGAGPAETADDFSVGADHVFVGRNSRDPVALFGDEGAWHNPGGLGVDPSSADFGATRFEAESEGRGSTYDFGEHSNYYDHDSESLYNLGRIVDGHSDSIVEADHSYDRWWGPATDPEFGRDPTSDVPGRSDTHGTFGGR
ncbi:alpha/beta hydrolase [Ruania halotolerans]|uniref:alpha/beta hydrolase n=1 Tax=Ruania halotolerans TaxID=2897773 RepID=UPI001E3BDE78|nr:alpha/beta hydrolase [Ruania halotolerans]UFU07387.1 alpha/beta hydrolase family protein [Ruania halotolerans]